MGTDICDGNLQVRGALYVSDSFYPPAGSIDTTAVTSDPTKRIDYTKIVQQRGPSVQLFAPGTAVTALTQLLVSMIGTTGSVLAFEAIITTQATGGDRTVSIDLQKSTGAGAFATILSAPIAITNATPIRTPQAAVISSASLVDADILQAVVTVAGAAGAQAAGLLLTLRFSEQPN